MTAPNHVSGGIVFTGIFCSLFNINIFENKYSIALVIFASLLPDIDHTKSLIGKMFYPLAKWISVKHGHRTITHSLAFYFGTTAIFLFAEKSLLNSVSFTYIYSFALLSHLVLDMITVQGIPLFYPFSKNPCVIPANPDLRIRSGNLKSEGVMLFIFAALTIFLQPLFSNGFWTSYNNQFNSIGHVFREFSNSENSLVIKYDYNFYNQKKTGSGVLIAANSNELKLIENDSLVRIQKEPNTQINELEINPTDRKLQFKKIVFQDIIQDSLMYIIENRYVLEGNVFSNNEVFFEGKRTQQITYSETFNPELPFIPNEKDERFMTVQSRYAKEYAKVSEKSSKKRKLQKHLVNLKEQIKSNDLSNYKKEKLGSEIIKTRKEIENISIEYSDLTSAENELRNFPKIGETKFNGVITFLEY